MEHGIEIDGVAVFAVDAAALHQNLTETRVAVYAQADNRGK